MDFDGDDRRSPAKEEAAIDLLRSIAAEDQALARLIRAEAEKIKAFVGKNETFPLDPSTEELIRLSLHVVHMMDAVVMKEWIGLKKMRDITSWSPGIWEDDAYDWRDE